MNSNKKIESSLKLKISDWELDFYSRPIIESNGKKRWELIICSTRSYKTEDVFLWNKKCPANEINSISLKIQNPANFSIYGVDCIEIN